MTCQYLANLQKQEKRKAKKKKKYHTVSDKDFKETQEIKEQVLKVTISVYSLWNGRTYRSKAETAFTSLVSLTS